ncbi:hypothetical protein [Acidisoma sp. 7E03]
MSADRFALPLRETLEINGYFSAMTPTEQAASYADFVSEHEQVCGAVCQRLAFLASHAGRPFPREEPA